LIFFLIFKIGNQIYTQKINIFSSILNCLFEICKRSAKYSNIHIPRHIVHRRHDSLLDDLALDVTSEQRSGRAARLVPLPLPLHNVQDRRVDVVGPLRRTQVDGAGALLVATQRRVVLQAIAAAVLVDGKVGHVLRGIATPEGVAYIINNCDI